jgi:heme/copper-type cytochrome/quinol oxidase subunit 1
MTFIGFNVTFFPMHWLGTQGMPRRVSDYAPRFADLNMIISIASFFLGASIIVFLYNMITSWARGPKAEANPWRARTLEWQVSSPPPYFNFARIPVVTGRHPLWEEAVDVAVPAVENDAVRSLGVEGAQERVTPITSGLDTSPEEVLDIPHETFLPFLLALGIGVFFVALLVKGVAIGVVGVVVAAIALVWWLWRTEADLA